MRKIILSFSVAFVLLLAVFVLNRVTYNKTKNFTYWTDHSRRIINLYSKLGSELRGAVLFSPVYSQSAAGDLYAIYKADEDSMMTTLLRLQHEVRDLKDQKVIADSLLFLTKRHIAVLQEKTVDELINAGEGWRFAELVKIHQLIERGLAMEETLLAQRRANLDSSNRQYNTFTMLLAIFALAIIISTFFSQFYLSKKSKWLEGFLESILNTSQNGILHCRAIRNKDAVVDFKLVYANKASSDLLGADPKTFTGKRWSEIPAFKDAVLFTACVNVIATQQETELEHLQTMEGREKSFALSVAKLKDGVTISFYEDTDIKRTAQELKRNITALEQTNRELEEYAYAASHDLQEPLRKIKTFGVFLKDTQYNRLDEKGRQQLDKNVQATERMTMLIKDLLSFSGLKTKDEEFEPTDLNEILENVLQDLDVMIAHKHAIITHEKLPEIYPIPVQINQLFYNLVNNSLKFSRADLPLHLDVSCRLVNGKDVADVAGLNAEDTYHEIIFSDNGIGFNQHYAKQIFELFKRLHDKGRYAGSGIGLSLCKKVVANHNGVIVANGKEGVGAQFYIYLPQSKSVKDGAVQEGE
jgi:signal transduction histidine kinase